MNINIPLVPVASVLVSLALGCAPVDGRDGSDPMRPVTTVCGRTHCDEVRSECTAEWAAYAARARSVGLIPDSEYSWCGQVCNGVANYCVREDFVVELGPSNEEVYAACGNFATRCLPEGTDWHPGCQIWADVSGPSILPLFGECGAGSAEPSREMADYIESSLSACGDHRYMDDFFLEKFGAYFRDSMVEAVMTCGSLSCEERRVDCFDSVFETAGIIPYSY